VQHTAPRRWISIFQSCGLNLTHI